MIITEVTETRKGNTQTHGNDCNRTLESPPCGCFLHFRPPTKPEALGGAHE